MKKKNQNIEIVRNIVLILIAVGSMLIFFNLDIIHKGKSMFTHSGSKRLEFNGSIGKDDLTDKEISRLVNYINKHTKILKKILLKASPQDSYRKITPKTQILFEVQITMHDGFTFTTPVRRVQRKELTNGVLVKLDKDIRAYLDLKKQGKEVKSLINTM
ncbi:hypothetical protein SYK_24530 [Pseudodesulfovibrio nedwellii]|uniref:Uncharacterized protein n=2 Tax=Pseudodesulfovibrio nedwellii TaxID=2973072 RepID=A0ABM8B2P7_9BACT|nr:hypothetical protein SYK_24530 [Pseudodesulfovibrio nedwellii]